MIRSSISINDSNEDLVVAYQFCKSFITEDKRKLRHYSTEEIEQFLKNFNFIKSIIVEKNENLAKKLTFNYIIRPDQFDAYYIEAINGIIDAIDRWNPKLGNLFSTYLTIRIKKRLRNYYEYNATDIRVPVHMQEKISALKKKNELSAEEMKLMDTYNKIRNPTSLSAIYDEDDSDYENISLDDDCPYDDDPQEENFVIVKNLGKEEKEVFDSILNDTCKNSKRILILKKAINHPAVNRKLRMSNW